MSRFEGIDRVLLSWITSTKVETSLQGSYDEEFQWYWFGRAPLRSNSPFRGSGLIDQREVGKRFGRFWIEIWAFHAGKKCHRRFSPTVMAGFGGSRDL